MSYTPLKISALGALLQNQAFTINSEAVGFIGSSTSLSNFTAGSLHISTGLSFLANAIRLGYTKINSGITQSEYNNLISIGNSNIPALGLVKPTTYTNTYTGEITSYGWLRLFAYQANKEFTPGDGSYTQFLYSFNACYSKKQQSNEPIKAIANSKGYLDGIYSNMNDLISSDIAGVNLSSFYWGQDLIATGKAIDLSFIKDFGNPQSLLKTLYKNQALTKAVNLALLSVGFTTTEIAGFCNGVPATETQQKLIYSAFFLISSTDLNDVCVILNCQTPNLNTLADLLDPKKLFPNSYQALTYPVYNSVSGPTNSKTYYLLYQGTGVQIINGLGIGDRLLNIIPADVAYAADAFSRAMMQIKNISTADIQKFSQVVRNLENVSDLTGVNGTNIPTNSMLADSALTALAKGSGTNGKYLMTDFFGCMTNLHYDYVNLQRLLQRCMSTTLAGIYTSIYNLLNGPGPYTNLQNLINQANTEITNIQLTNASLATELNTLYNEFGTLLNKEVDARTLALGVTDDWLSYTSNTDVTNFIDSLDQYAVETEIEGASQVLENIIDLTTQGGNYVIAAMREARNAQRLGLAGLALDNNVNSTERIALPMISGSTLQDSPIAGYPNSDTVNNIPIVTGSAVTPGSLAGSPETMLVPDNLSILVQPSDKSILTPDQAVAEVVLCNCDCWDML
jgi:hypothetical protein